MKTKQFITIILAILLVGLQLPVSQTWAQDTPQDDTSQTGEAANSSKAEKKCAEKMEAMDFEKIHSEWEEKWLEIGITSAAMQEAFESAQKAYHEYVECIFSFAEAEILKSEGSEAGGTADANTPNVDVPVASYLIDWMSPPAACLEEKAFLDTIKDTNPGATVKPLLAAHEKYTEHLLGTLLPIYEEKGREVDEEGERLTGHMQVVNKAEMYAKIQRKFDDEINNAYVAMDIAFSGLKELRLAFVMHVQFQCMLKNLELYRKLLEDIRWIVEGLPTRLRDASIH